MQEPTLWLIDGSSYIYRAFYALPPLTNKKGIPTGAIYGLVKMLKKLVARENPEYLCIALDPAGKTERHEYFEQYKANRSAMPDELKAQIHFVEPLLTALGFKTIKVKGEEADDVIGSLSKIAISKGMQVKISSPDKDFAQLVNNSIILENTMSDKSLDTAGVITKFGVRPEQIIDYLALVGDTADNIPGIPKVGPKTAIKWLNIYNSISGLAENLASIKGAVGQNLRDNFDKIPLYKKLVTIKQDLDLAVEIKDLVIQAPNEQALKEIYTELEFSTWLKELGQPVMHEYQKIQIIDIDNWQIFLDSAPKLIAVQPEAEYVSLATSEADIICYIDFLKVIADLSRVKNITIIGFAVKSWFQVEHLNPGILFDIQLAQYVIDSQLPNNTFSDLLAAHEVEHSGRILFELYQDYQVKLGQNPSKSKLLTELEIPIAQILYNIEQKGVLLDPKILEQLTEEFTAEIESIGLASRQYSKTDFNLASPKQLRKVLFEELSLPVLKKTAKGEASTSEDALQALSKMHPLAELIVRHRQLSKLLSTYTIPLPNLVAADGRVHSQFNQVNTVTGRLSSNNPNLQNIPIRSAQGQKIRRAFIAAADHVLLSADYSQIELRIMAHLSQDDGLMSAFEQSLDVHSHTAANIFECDILEVNSEQRRRAKAINFGLIYGMSAFGLAKQIQTDHQQAQALIDNYFKRYPGVLQYMEATRRFAKHKGYVETLFGRRLYLPDINSSKRQLAMAAERAAINAPMQGTSADMIKQAMIDIMPGLNNFSAHMILQVHDELIFEVPTEFILALSNFVKDKMLNAVNLSVPLEVNLSSGRSWGTLQKIRHNLFDS